MIVCFSPSFSSFPSFIHCFRCKELFGKIFHYLGGTNWSALAFLSLLSLFSLFHCVQCFLPLTYPYYYWFHFLKTWLLMVLACNCLLKRDCIIREKRIMSVKKSGEMKRHTGIRSFVVRQIKIIKFFLNIYSYERLCRKGMK